MFRFMSYKWIYALISGIVLIPGILALLMWGLKPSLDFTGGSIAELRFANQINRDELRDALTQTGIETVSIQDTGSLTYLVRAKEFDKNKNEELKDALTQKFGGVDELRYESVGPVIGKELTVKTVTAIVIAGIAILLYITFAFRKVTGVILPWQFGLSAVLALIHDTLATIGIFAILGHFFNVEVDALFVTAVLTIMSFSVHDTIVVFDRIREVLKRMTNLSIEEASNLALTETMTRSINNSLTIIFMLFALLLLGGTTIRWFVFALLIGTIFGVYSSPFVATPLLNVFGKLSRKKKAS